MKKLNDFMLDANKALPDVLRFWVYFLLGLGLSYVFLGQPLTCIIFGGIVLIEVWALVVEIVRDHREEKARRELLERMVNDPGSFARAFNNLGKAIEGVFNGDSYRKEEDED
ncbi:hypothetical protein LI142_08340 [Eubacterium limosum]|uniref:hypothetical protein n=1 Tax=Eubacterium limosum TaxID=1736 RepID=UPI001D095F7B|nr:hypothetical protein [Eubacterium limosum]MCB6569508.1 hypothetical protein [Eubacterium limosum]